MLSPFFIPGRSPFSTFSSSLFPTLPPKFLIDGAYDSLNINMNHYPVTSSSTSISSSIASSNSSQASATSTNIMTSQTETSTLNTLLEEIILYGQLMNKNSIWIHLDLDSATTSLSSLTIGNILSLSINKGFQFHHSNNYSIKLYKWLPKNIPNKVPLYATHQIGVAGVVIDNAGRLLLVQERRQSKSKPSSSSSTKPSSTSSIPSPSIASTSSPQWKFPGGLADIGEAFSTTAEREVYEETGLRTKFQSILAFRHQHGMSYGVSDIYILCLLRPCSLTYQTLLTDDKYTKLPLQIDTNEILDAQWMNVSDYLSLTTHPLNKQVAELALYQLHKENIVSSSELKYDKSIKEIDMYIPITKKHVKVYMNGNVLPNPTTNPSS